MAYEALKIKMRTMQDKLCAISGVELDEDTSLFDIHRSEPKANGGDIELENTEVVDPVGHMRFHGNYREREETIDMLKSIVDDRKQVIRLRNKIANQLLAYERRTDNLNAVTKQWLEQQLTSYEEQLTMRDKMLKVAVREIAKEDPLANAALSVSCVGEITVALCLVYIDLNKARHASSLWKYAGLDKPSHERYKKGEAGGGNKDLRCALWNMANSQIKGYGPYREVYENVKHRLSHSEKIVKTRNTKGELVELPWKDTKPSHRNDAGKRAMMKHFLADYWMVGRTIFGLPTGPLYPEAVLGGNHRTVRPEERGWKY